MVLSCKHTVTFIKDFLLPGRMAEKEKLGSQKRYGPRYGRKLRLKVAAIEKEQKKNHKCPYCSYNKVKRQGLGIWACTKCGNKFAGRAYKPGR